MLFRSFLLSFKAGDVVASNSAVASMKCRQICGGSVYGEDRTTHVVHTAKLDALEDLIEELSGQPALVAILMGTITGAFGGVLRDLVCNEIPALFRDHRPYAVCAFAGGVGYEAIIWLGLPDAAAITGERLVFRDRNLGADRRRVSIMKRGKRKRLPGMPIRGRRQAIHRRAVRPQCAAVVPMSVRRP